MTDLFVGTSPFNTTASFRFPFNATVDDLANLRARVATSLAAGCKYVIIDFEPAGYVSSSALGQTVAIHRSVVEHGGELILCGMDMKVRSMMAKAKLDRLVEHVTDHAAAWDLVRARIHAKSHDRVTTN
jgi:anti-anti-sigma factor